MHCCRDQILTNLEADEEIEIKVSENNQYITISSGNSIISVAHADMPDFIVACISAENFMDFEVKKKLN